MDKKSEPESKFSLGLLIDFIIFPRPKGLTLGLLDGQLCVAVVERG